MKTPDSAPVAVITGASSGIGEALARRYAAAGWHLALAARSREPLERLCAHLTQLYGVKTLAVITDVSREADCRHLIQRAVDAYGQIDLLVNNAGISMRAPFGRVDLGVLERLMQVNFWGAVSCTQEALPWLIQSRGSIVGVSSIAGFRGLPYRTGYSASKFALQGFLESLRTELLPTGVHVLIACPGFTQSNIRQVALSADGTPQGESPRHESRMMTAEAVAERIYRAQQRRKRYLVLTTEGILTRWLNWLAPSWMDRKVWQAFEREQQRAGGNGSVG